MITHGQLLLIPHRCQNSGSEIDALILIVYSVIIELIWLLPGKFSPDKDFGPDRFSVPDRREGRFSRVGSD